MKQVYKDIEDKLAQIICIKFIFKMNVILTFLLSVLLVFIFSINSAFGYSSNGEISVVRQMPAYAIAGETITVEISLDIGTEIFAIRGFYLTDEVPNGLIIEGGSARIILNEDELTNILEEIGASGEVVY